MTSSATLPSTTVPVVHGGFSTPEEEDEGAATSEAPRPSKRCIMSALPDSCKKRRKQSTPVRISAAEADFAPPQHEGKPSAPSPECEYRCPLCQQSFAKSERLQAHLVVEHGNVECKKEPEDGLALTPNSAIAPNYEHPFETTTTTTTTSSRNELPWMGDFQSKEWLGSGLHGLPFTTATSLFMSLPPFSQPDTVSNRHQVRIFNPDAFCDLCNKEFCNKYFLKTHKANKHGVYTDPPLTDALAASSVTVPSYTSSAKLSDMPHIKNESKSQLNAANPFSDIFTNDPSPFPSKFFPKMAKPNMQGTYESETPESVANDTSATPCNGQNERNIADTPPEDTPLDSPKNEYKSEFNFEQEQHYFNLKMSPSQQVRELDLNRLRRIGVMNPKAFCEICCKEYCNKYFLRTHKMKRHGIFIPDENKEKDTKIDSGGNSSWTRNMQTSPLNLIMTEQTNSSSSGRKTNSPTDNSCDTCGIKFQNAGLAQLHNVSVHAKMSHEQSDPDDANRSIADITANNDKSINSGDAISEDLQKLQTMILQLNDLDVSRVTAACSVCNKEFENRYYLHAHMMTEHGLLVDEGGEGEKVTINEGDTAVNTSTCELCNKEVLTVEEMRKHMIEAHPGHQQQNVVKEEYFPTLEKSTGRTTTNTSGTQYSERRSSSSLTPSSSYCEICNKELCNKYFMKTHMQRMHGIEIENGAQIGGVICDICNKELCSKYFLRVHKHNTHGIVEYGSTLLQPRKNDTETPAVLPSEPDPSLKPGDLADLSHRYFTHFTEVCPICSRRFRSTKWLKAHLLSDHGQIGAEKWAELEQQLQQSISAKPSGNVTKNSQSEQSSPTLKIPNGGHDQKLNIQNVLSSIFGADETVPKNYHCSYCAFSTPVLPFLFVHERSHSVQQTGENENVPLKCPVCAQNFPQPELLQHHLFTQHPFFPLPPFFNGNSDQQSEQSKETGDACEDETKTDEIDQPKPSQQFVPLHQPLQPPSKSKKSKRKVNRSASELPQDVCQSLKDVAKRSQLPATYALPQITDQQPSGYTMQAFLVDQEQGVERRFLPSVVFLPVLHKQSAPLTATFTLTPA